MKRGVSILKKVHDEMNDGPDKIAVETTMRVLEDEARKVEERTASIVT